MNPQILGVFIFLKIFFGELKYLNYLCILNLNYEEYLVFNHYTFYLQL